MTASQPTTRPRLETFGPREVLRLGDTACTLATEGVREVARRGPALARSPKKQSARGIARALRRSAEDLGPAYIKFGQIIASSPGLFPRTLSYEFRKCLDRVPPMPTYSVYARIRDELGAPITSIFDSFDPKPLASASIAQVHAATIDGHEVVVKVRRPGLVRRFRHDLRILYQLARALESGADFFHVFQPTAIVDDFARTLYEEIDFVREAESMDSYRENLASYGDNSKAIVPEVMWEHTTERVLTMSREYGVAPDDAKTIVDEWGLDVVPLFQHAVRSWVEAVFVHGLFHGDLHAGNLLVNERAEVVFLDFGIMGRMRDDHREIMRALLPTMVIDEDWDRAARLLVALTPARARLESEVDAIGSELETVIAPMASRRIREISYGEALSEALRITRAHGQLLPQEIVLIAKQFLYFERYARILAPDYAVFGDQRIFETLLTNQVRAVAEPEVPSRLPTPEVHGDEWGRSIARAADVHFEWTYTPENQGLVRLYEKAKTSQWNSTTDIDWSIDLDPREAGAGFGGYLQMIPSDVIAKMSDAERADTGLQLSAWMNSQFMHGEQGALMATAASTISCGAPTT